MTDAQKREMIFRFEKISHSFTHSGKSRTKEILKTLDGLSVYESETVLLMAMEWVQYFQKELVHLQR